MFEVSAYGDSTRDSTGNHRAVFGRERHQDDPAGAAEPPEDSHQTVNKTRVHAFLVYLSASALGILNVPFVFRDLSNNQIGMLSNDTFRNLTKLSHL